MKAEEIAPRGPTAPQQSLSDLWDEHFRSECESKDAMVMGFDEFIDLLQGNRAGPAVDLDGILDDIRGVASGSGFSDDVSILRLDFGG